MEIIIAWDSSLGPLFGAVIFGGFVSIMATTIASLLGFRVARKHPVWMTIVTFIILAGIGNTVSWLYSASGNPDRLATLSEAIGEYGLKDGASYPLYLDGTANSIAGTETLDSGIFSASSVVDLKPSTVVNIGFRHGELWWPLSLPASKSPFKVTDGEPSVTIWFQDVKSDPSRTVIIDEQPVYWDVVESGCKPFIHNLWLTCKKEVLSETLVVSEEWKNMSIPDFFDNYFSRAEINLTPEQHAVLFPKN